MSVHRRLSALFFADIVDYSGLSARDEARALRLVPVFQAATRDVVGRYGGRIVKFLGDGVLAEFPSTGNAIGAAGALLVRFEEESGRGMPESAALRIGVHVGDIAISEDGDVYGDGVNVTARLCEEAPAGRILASEDVYRQLKQRSEFVFLPRSDRELKGVGEVGTYEVSVPNPVEPDLEAIQGRQWERRAGGVRHLDPRLLLGAGVVLVALALWATRAPWHSWLGADSAESATLDPSRLAVLYFRDQSESGDLEHLADGFTEALIRELGGIEGLKVVSRYGVRPYDDTDFPIDSVALALQAGTIIDGAVSRSGDSLRVQVQLVDATDMTQIASFTEVRPWSEMFSLQDEITADVSTALRRRLGQEIVLRQQRRATSSVEAWEVVQRAERMAEQARGAGSEDAEIAAAVRVEADSLLARAEGLDPAWIEPTLARARIAFEIGSAGSLIRGLDLVGRALASHPDNAEALTVKGALQMALARQAADSTRAAGLLVAAERDLRIAVASDPTSARAWITLADLLYNDKWELSEAREAARRAYEKDVFLLEDDHFKWLCEISIQLEDHDDAARWCEEGRRRFPNDVYLMMADLTRLASAGEAEPEAGWGLVREIGRQRNPEFNVPAAKMYMAAILARGGDADSAQATAAGARQGMADEDRTSLEPSLDYIEAYMEVLLRDERSALRLLRSSFTGYPPYRASAARDYWFESLEGDPRFESLVDRVHLPIFCRILCRPPE
jgi:class 3 adenylate cyclase/TolB-like protein/Tfp pilus assembly protein PilF